MSKISELPDACVLMGEISLVTGRIELELNEYSEQPGLWMLVVDGEIARFSGADTRDMRGSALWWQRSGNSDRHNHFASLLHSALDAGKTVELFGCRPECSSYVAKARDWRQEFSFAWS
jgi:hypothetical protein